MSENHETASKLSELFKPYGVARVTVPIEKTEYGGGLYRIEFDEDSADENPDQPKHFVLCAASADDIPDNFTFIGTRSIEEQPDGRGIINLGSADDHAQDEKESQLKDSVSYFMRKEMGGERALYEMLGVVSELFEEMAAFSKREYSDMETARSFSESAENCEIVRDVIANRNSRKR